MQESSNGDSGSENPDTVYVIFRVFNVDKYSVDLRVYMDPEVMRRRGDLSFTGEKWSIVPAATRL